MSPAEPLHGLSCPRCGGMVPIPEGQALVICPFCELRSVVRGENGIRRYQVPNRIDHTQAAEAMRGFLTGRMAVARDAARTAQLTEVFLVHLPFWAAWGRGLGWAFGRQQVGSGDKRRYEPRELRLAEELTWNGAACDVGEFGVNVITLKDRPLEPFNPDALHATGMVFEPVGSPAEALQKAETEFDALVRKKTRLDQLSQTFVRVVRPRLGLVYYPLWVVRYLYHGRAFQVAVDGFSGEVLYGKAPGSVLYRALALVGGMAAGAFVAIDIPALVLNGNDSDGLEFALIAFVAGLVIMYAAFRVFRYGEHYEYRRYRSGSLPGGLSILPADGLLKAGEFLRQVEKFR